jgi:excisionase family DNA binding protein
MNIPESEEQISTEEAARLLFTSHTYLERMLDANQIPSVHGTQGDQRGVRKVDVIGYKDELRIRQQAALNTLVKTSEAMRLYDVKSTAPRAPKL